MKVESYRRFFVCLFFTISNSTQLLEQQLHVDMAVNQVYRRPSVSWMRVWIITRACCGSPDSVEMDGWRVDPLFTGCRDLMRDSLSHRSSVLWRTKPPPHRWWNLRIISDKSCELLVWSLRRLTQHHFFIFYLKYLCDHTTQRLLSVMLMILAFKMFCFEVFFIEITVLFLLLLGQLCLQQPVKRACCNDMWINYRYSCLSEK